MSGALGGGLHTAWALELMRGLRAAGAGWAFVCPGSRSTPLALAAAEVFGASLSVVIDERSAAFAALGFARLSGAPAVVIVTSGSAGAHALPAIIEAEQASVPLIVITADRPIELYEAGASQTIDQHQIFGRHVRAAFEIGAPDAEALSSVGRIAFRVVREALGPQAGAVHVNARFRKPLEPTQALPTRLPSAPAVELFLGERVPSAKAIAYVQAALEESERPLVVLGPLPFGATARSEVQATLAALLSSWTGRGVPVAVELTSGVAGGPQSHLLPLALLLESGAFEGAMPDLIIELASPPVSSSYASLASAARRRVVVSPQKSPDPFNSANAFIEADAIAFARAALPAALPNAQRYATRLARASDRARAIVADAKSPDGVLSEPAAMRAVAAALPESAILAVGNSLAVRDLDLYGPSSSSHVVLHQRGAAGIDGLVAGAFGARLAAEASAPVALVIGDVSAQHDVASFALLRDVDAPLLVIVIDNGGGRIFEGLPVKGAIDRPAFEKLFTTAPAPFLEGAVEAFGVAHVTVTSASELARVVTLACQSPKATVIRVVTPYQAGQRDRAAIRAALREVTHA